MNSSVIVGAKIIERFIKIKKQRALERKLMREKKMKIRRDGQIFFGGIFRAAKDLNAVNLIKKKPLPDKVLRRQAVWTQKRWIQNDMDEWGKRSKTNNVNDV